MLGPILFLIYINDLDYGIRNWILKFADDIKMFSRMDGVQDRVWRVSLQRFKQVS